jgi:hypothetical protein
MEILTLQAGNHVFHALKKGAGARSPFWWLLFCCLWQFIIVPTSGQVSKEYQLKAVFLWRFAQFVHWPTNAFASPESPIVIGILGSSPFGHALEEVVREETANHRKLTVQYYERVDEIKTCHILYISESEALRVERVTAALANRSILTVSDIDQFAKTRGGMIHFVTDQNKVRFRINLGAATAARLVLDARLLRMAETVGER